MSSLQLGLQGCAQTSPLERQLERPFLHARDSHSFPKGANRGDLPGCWAQRVAFPRKRWRVWSCAVSEPELNGSIRTRNLNLRDIAKVVTATKLQHDSTYVRVFGPGVDISEGIGRLLALDEIFGGPLSCSTSPSPTLDGAIPESLLYYIDTPPEEEPADLAETTTLGTPASVPAGSTRGRHAVHLHLASSFGKPLQLQGSEIAVTSAMFSAPSFVPPPMVHMRESAFSPTTKISGQILGDSATAGSGGGATVTVVAGQCGKLTAPPPLQDILFLDVQMQPNSQVALPLPATYSAMAYILEGVGIFGQDSRNGNSTTFYENEGHGLYMPASRRSADADEFIVKTAPWSGLRFIVVGAPAH